MKIYVKNAQSLIPISAKAVKEIVLEVIQKEGESCDEVSVSFITSKKLCRMHAQYFGDPSPTDCISFPMEDSSDDTYRILGDIFVCPETAIEYCLYRRTNPFEEITLYIVHGLLHLMGYDDMNSKDRKKMRAAERCHMRNLKAHNLILRN